MIDTLKQKMTHIMCLNLNKMSNTSIFLITIFSRGRLREELNSKNSFQMNDEKDPERGRVCKSIRRDIYGETISILPMP